MSEIKNGGLDQYGAEPFEQQQFGTAGVEGSIMFSSRTVSKLSRCIVQIITFDRGFLLTPYFEL